MVSLLLMCLACAFSSCAWSAEGVITFEKESCHGSVGSVVTMKCRVPPRSLSSQEIQASLAYDPFFSNEGGVATLLSIIPEGPFLILSFIPKGVGKGVSLFAPIRRNDIALSWAPFSYSFSLPMPPLFSYPLMDRFMKPLISSSHPLLAKEMSEILKKQQKSFEVQEEARTLFWNVLLVVMGLILVFPYGKERCTVFLSKARIYTMKRKREKLLEEAVREKRADWSLLLRHLLFLYAREGALHLQTALDLARLFQEKGENNLAHAALLIDRYGYLPQECFEQFLQAYSLCFIHSPYALKGTLSP